MDYWTYVVAFQTTVPKLSNIYQNENKVLSKYKGKINEKGDKGIKCKDDDVDIDEKIHEENPYGDFYINEEPLMDIAIEQLWNVIEEKSRNEDDGFKKEYAVGTLYRKPCTLKTFLKKTIIATVFFFRHSSFQLVFCFFVTLYIFLFYLMNQVNQVIYLYYKQVYILCERYVFENAFHVCYATVKFEMMKKFSL